jgi:hypothetical protein
MNAQAELSFVPIARATDPVTSHEAALEQTISGRRETHTALVYRLVCANPGATYRELFRAANGAIAEAVEVQRRLGSDLAQLDPRTGVEVPDSLVVRRGSRVCRESGRSATCWWPRG